MHGTPGNRTGSPGRAHGNDERDRTERGDGRLDTTRYTPDGGLLWPKYAVAAFGTVAFVIAVGTPG